MDHVIKKCIKETQDYVSNRAMEMESRVYLLEAENKDLREQISIYKKNEKKNMQNTQKLIPKKTRDDVIKSKELKIKELEDTIIKLEGKIYRKEQKINALREGIEKLNKK